MHQIHLHARGGCNLIKSQSSESKLNSPYRVSHNPYWPTTTPAKPLNPHDSQWAFIFTHIIKKFYVHPSNVAIPSFPHIWSLIQPNSQHEGLYENYSHQKTNRLNSMRRAQVGQHNSIGHTFLSPCLWLLNLITIKEGILCSEHLYIFHIRQGCNQLSFSPSRH